MFNSIKFISHNRDDFFDSDFNLYDYVIIDSEFGIIEGVAVAPCPCPGTIAIITEYQKRFLNVEGNLAIYLCEVCEKHKFPLKEVLFSYEKFCNRREDLDQLWKNIDINKILKYMVFS